MGVRERSPGRFTVSKYDQALGRKVHVGTFWSLDQALEVEILAKRGEYEPPTRARHIPMALEPVVYFVAATGLGLVKIGYTTNLRQRFGELSRGIPVDIALLRYMSASREFERKLHGRFAHLRARGEWFRNEGALAAFLNDEQLELAA